MQYCLCKLGAAKLFNETMNCFMVHLLPRRRVSRKPLLQANACFCNLPGAFTCKFKCQANSQRITMAYLCFASQQALLKIRGDAVRINNKPVGAYVWATGGSLRMQHAYCVSMRHGLWENVVIQVCKKSLEG